MQHEDPFPFAGWGDLPEVASFGHQPRRQILSKHPSAGRFRAFPSPPASVHLSKTGVRCGDGVRPRSFPAARRIRRGSRPAQGAAERRAAMFHQRIHAVIALLAVRRHVGRPAATVDLGGRRSLDGCKEETLKTTRTHRSWFNGHPLYLYKELSIETPDWGSW